MGLLYLMINWYVFIIIAQYLEAYWGTFLFNLYCLFVFAFSIFAAFFVLLIFEFCFHQPQVSFTASFHYIFSSAVITLI